MIRTSPDTGAGGDSAFPIVDDFNEVDEMVLEYLLFRGFTRSFRAVAADCKADRIRCFEADMVVAELLELITAHDLRGFHSLWTFLDARFFSHLDAAHRATVSDLRTRLDRTFLVHALTSDRRDLVHLFFQTFGADLHQRSASIARQQSASANTSFPFQPSPSSSASSPSSVPAASSSSSSSSSGPAGQSSSSPPSSSSSSSSSVAAASSAVGDRGRGRGVGGASVSSNSGGGGGAGGLGGGLSGVDGLTVGFGLAASSHSSWSEWFALPYALDPASDPAFKAYFSPQWVASLKLSLLNFLSLVFRATPLPKLLLLEKWHKGPHQLHLRRGLHAQQEQGDLAAHRVRALEGQVGSLLHVVSDLAAHVHRSSVDSARRATVNRNSGSGSNTQRGSGGSGGGGGGGGWEGDSGGSGSGGSSSSVGGGRGGGVGGASSLFEEDEHAKERLDRMRGEGGRVLLLASNATAAHASSASSSLSLSSSPAATTPSAPESSLAAAAAAAAEAAAAAAGLSSTSLSPQYTCSREDVDGHTQQQQQQQQQGGGGGGAGSKRISPSGVEELAGAVEQWLRTLQAGTNATSAVAEGRV